MFLEEAIHSFWQNSARLGVALSAERFFTATTTPPTIPCVVLFLEKTEVLFHTNQPEPLKKTDIRFEIHHDSYTKGAAVARLVEETFDRLRLGSYQFRLTRSENLPAGENYWKFIRRFQVIG